MDDYIYTPNHPHTHLSYMHTHTCARMRSSVLSSEGLRGNWTSCEFFVSSNDFNTVLILLAPSVCLRPFFLHSSSSYLHESAGLPTTNEPTNGPIRLLRVCGSTALGRIGAFVCFPVDAEVDQLGHWWLRNDDSANEITSPGRWPSVQRYMVLFCCIIEAGAHTQADTHSLSISK